MIRINQKNYEEAFVDDPVMLLLNITSCVMQFNGTCDICRLVVQTIASLVFEIETEHYMKIMLLFRFFLMRNGL